MELGFTDDKIDGAIDRVTERYPWDIGKSNK